MFFFQRIVVALAWDPFLQAFAAYLVYLPPSSHLAFYKEPNF